MQTTDFPPDFYDRALRRIGRLTIVLGAIGVAAALLLRGPTAAGGFFLGAAISALNFARLRRLAAALGASEKVSGKGIGSLILSGSGYLIAAAAIYVIVKITGVDLGAVFAGLLVAFAAVFLEVIYELVFIKL